VRSETWTPMWVDAAMTGSTAIRATAEGSRATIGANRARKMRNRRRTMNSTESSSVSVWVLACCARWSMAWAAGPVRWMARPGGTPEEATAPRTAAMVRVASGPVDDAGMSRATTAWRARPSPDTPWSSTAVTRGTVATARSARSMVALSAVVSGPVVEAATSSACVVLRGWNGAARVAARTLGCVAGRKSALLLFSTLEMVGRPTTRATVTAAQATTIAQRNRTVKRPSAVKNRRSSNKCPPYVRGTVRVRG
jgi:hypothetical protein